MKKYYILGLFMVTMLFTMMACSKDDNVTLRSQLCHAWYWHDEMPKSYYSLLAFKPNGRFEVVMMIYTDNGTRKKIVEQGSYNLDGDKLTLMYDKRYETYTFRIVIENDEVGYTMYWYSDENEHQSQFSTYYASEGTDAAYLYAPEYQGE